MKLPKTLPPPDVPGAIPKNAKWLSGEGAGSWFVIEKLKDNFLITRYSPTGVLECENNFKSSLPFNPKDDFTMNYPSHCAVVSVIQEGSKIIFKEDSSSEV